MSYPDRESVSVQPAVASQGDDAVDPFRLPLKRWLAAPIEWLTGLRRLSRLYRARPDSVRGAHCSHEFLSYALKTLDTGVEPDNYAALGDIPAEGPVIFVANHPLGALEGIAMTDLLLHLRPDTKVLTNELLTRVPELSDLFFGVDVLSANAKAGNARGMRGVYKHLSAGGAILIYPSGEVSGFDTHTGRIQDTTWHPLVGRLARRYGADCVPFYVMGRNSWWFYCLGVLHPFLRTLRLPRELLNKQGIRFKLLVGSVVATEQLQALRSDKEATQWLRKCSEILAQRAKLIQPKTRVVKVGQSQNTMKTSKTASLK